MLRTDSRGYYEAPVEKEILYLAKAVMPQYFGDCLTFRFATLDPENCNPAPRDLLLDKFGLNQVFRIENIYYDLDKWFIRPDARPPLDNIVRIMNQHPINIELSSHTDCRASFEYNQILSQRRAEAAVQYITSNGINPSRLVARGYGETMLVNHCADGVPCTEAQHQANRRTEFKITSVSSQFVEEKSFDPNIFKAGDKIPVHLLEADFYSDCLLTKADRSGSPDLDNSRSGSSVPAPVVPASTLPQTPVAATVTTPQQGTNIPKEQQPVAAPAETAAKADHSGTNPLTEDSFFTVQLKAATQPMSIDNRNFPGISGVFEKKIGVYYKYYYGMFPKLQEALNQRTVLNNSFPGCFIVAFKKGNVVSINELTEHLK